MSTKQSQAGGNNSTNLQAQAITVNVGIDEKRAREIYQEMSLQLRKEYAQEALSLAAARVQQFEDRLMPKMEKVEGALGAFADPGFQLLLVEAQKSAASTERPADYDLLSELLIHRFQRGENRVLRAGISRAVEIVDKISDEALLGLTVAHSVSTFSPASGDISQGLDVLNELYGALLYGELPKGQDWLDHLDILDAVRLNSFGGLKKIKQYYPDKLSGYVDPGIEKNSADHHKAIDLLAANAVPHAVLVDHAFDAGFVRISVPRREAIRDFHLQQRSEHAGIVVTQTLPITKPQVDAINAIYDLYRKDANLRNKNIDAFLAEWDKRANLKILREWWDQIPTAFQVTSVGKVLAHSNAQRCDKSLPPLD
jgi:hypothetical protein